MKLIFLGAPGVGKGTVAGKCAAHYGIVHISTGDIFRAHIKQQTELGKKVSAILQQGGLVPDQLTIELVQDRLGQDDVARGYILDGFPRTIGQAKSLDSFAAIDVALLFSLSRDSIVQRLSGRRIHKPSGRIYHVTFNPPKVGGKDDLTGEELTQRADDRPEAIVQRLELYDKETAPLIEYYRTQNLLLTVDASPAPKEVFAAVQAHLSAYE